MRNKGMVYATLLLGAVLLLAGCSGLPKRPSSKLMDFAEDSETTVFVVFYGFTPKNYNGIPIGTKPKMRASLPPGRMKFHGDAEKWETVGNMRFSWKVIDVEFEVNITETVNWETKQGKYYVLWFHTPSDGLWGIQIQEYELGRGIKYEVVGFAPFMKDGQTVAGKNYKPN